MIKELTFEEADQLREGVRSRFLQSPFNGAGLRISQHKASYQHLADDIIQVVPDAKTSVTANRLRKLFYYTNPAVCAPDKLEKPSFGSDFIQILFQYVGEEEPKPKPIPQPRYEYEPRRPAPRKWLWRGVALLLLLAGAAAVWLWPRSPKGWEERFDEVSVDSLKSRDWKILDYDSAMFSKQLKPGCLTLHTLMGDTWVWWAIGEKPMIKNMLVKRLGSPNCFVTARIAGGFDPDQNWQQAGVFLYDQDLGREQIFRVTFAADRNENFKYEHQGKRVRLVQKIQTILIHNQSVATSNRILRFPEYQPVFPDIGLRLTIRGQKIIVNFWVDGDGSPLEEENKREIDLPFTPAYVGIAAFQGNRTYADTIPVFFDYVKVEPLPE